LGAITTSPKSVVNHDRKQIPPGKDETACPLKGGREPTEKGKYEMFNLQNEGSTKLSEMSHRMLFRQIKRMYLENLF
jgi:hypothetical protein